MKTIGIIGCGNMGSALAGAIARKFGIRSVIIFDQDVTKTSQLSARSGAQVAASVSDLVGQSDVVIVAVKPQDCRDLLMAIASALEGRVLVSVAAGLAIERIQRWVGKAVFVVRAMPNLNAAIGQSVTAICAGETLPIDQSRFIEDMFRCVGDVVVVAQSEMNAVTAVSGSGPAFYAYVRDEMSDAQVEDVLYKQAKALGIHAEAAKILAHRTVIGTAAMLNQSGIDPQTFIGRVCSKGGTTESGMTLLRRGGKTPQGLAEALFSASQRAAQLSEELSE